ncbi:MAG: hypothetical protein AAF411_00595 [Myxococcota bacterium]
MSGSAGWQGTANVLRSSVRECEGGWAHGTRSFTVLVIRRRATLATVLGSRFLLGLCMLLVACTDDFTIGPEADGSIDMEHPEGVSDAGSDGRQDVSFELGAVDASDETQVSVRCEPENRCAGTCELPWLLAPATDSLAAQGVPTSDDCGGRVLRFSLAAESVCACASYELSDPLPRTASYIPGGTVVVGSTTAGVRTFGAARAERRFPSGFSAFGSFIVEGETPGSAPIAVVLGVQPGRVGAYFIVTAESNGTLTEVGQRFAESNTIDGDSFTQNPNDRRGFRYSELNRSSVNQQFWRSRIDEFLHFVNGPSGHIEAFWANGFHRTTVARSQGVRHVANAAFRIENAPIEQRCAGPDYEACSYTAAAPDPRSEHHIFVACVADSAARIARMDVRDDSCIDVLPPGLWRNIRIPDLSIALESYWAP